MQRRSANLLLLLAGAIWGMGFVAQQTAMDSVGPFTFIALRFLIATIVVLPFAIAESRRPKEPLPPLQFQHFVQFGAIGLCLWAGMSLQQVALQTITVTNAGFLTGLYVVFTPLLGVLLYRQWPHFIVWPACSIALLGIYFLSGSNLSQLQLGDALTVAGALCWALQVLLIARYVGRSNRPLALSAAQFFVTSVLAGVAGLAFEAATWAGIQGALTEILYAGIFATGIAFSLQVIGQRYTSPAQAAIFLSSEALFAALFGALFLHERVGLLGLFGCALIFCSMLLVELVPMYFKTFDNRSTRL